MKWGRAWFKRMGLQLKLINAFLIMGLIVLVVGWVGQTGSSRLSEHLNEISAVRLPSIVGLQMMDRGLKGAQAGELALLNTRLSEALRQDQLTSINLALEEIRAGYEKYEPLPRSPREDKLWRQFLSKRDRWQQEHESFMLLYQQFERVGIFLPVKRQLELLRQGKENSPEMEAAIAANILLEQMNVQGFTINQPAYRAAAQVLQKLIQENENLAKQAKNSADQSVRQTQFWVLLGTITGPVMAVLLGIALSIAIAKPFNRAIQDIINKIVSFSSQLAATVAEQERIATEQAISVSDTTTTMDELSASSQQSAMQAEAASVGAGEALTLANEGTQVVGQTLEGMSALQQKVTDIAKQIVRLNEQTRQIGSISTLVGDVAAQTHMLALNAAVEAARAGEYGKGLAVVAAEIRKLADQSKTSAQKINGLVGDIQRAIDSTVIVTDEGTTTVQAGVQQVQRMAEVFAGVSEAINKVVANNQQISLAAQQQAVAIHQVVNAMNSINTGAQQTATGISQTKLGTQQLNEVALNLRAVV